MIPACKYNAPDKGAIRGSYSAVTKVKREDETVLWTCTHKHKNAEEALTCAEAHIKIEKLFKEKTIG